MALPIGRTAPGFELKLVGRGNFSLEQSLKKGPVVLAFFKVSCPVCQYAFPYLERLDAKLSGKGVCIIGVSQDDEASTERFARQFGVTFPIALDDPNGYLVSNAYKLETVPTIYEINNDGTIATSSVGWSRSDVEAIYARHAKQGDKPESSLFERGESVADFRTG